MRSSVDAGAAPQAFAEKGSKLETVDDFAAGLRRKIRWKV